MGGASKENGRFLYKERTADFSTALCESPVYLTSSIFRTIVPSALVRR